MVLVEDLGKDLEQEYVVINIERDVVFLDEIRQKLDRMGQIYIQAWGPAINLAVRLALETRDGIVPGTKIISVEIGTEPGVELRAREKRKHGGSGGDGEVPPPRSRVVKSISWMRITLSKGQVATDTQS